MRRGEGLPKIGGNGGREGVVASYRLQLENGGNGEGRRRGSRISTREWQKWKDERGCRGMMKATRKCVCELIIGLLIMIIIPSSYSIIN